MWPWFCPSPQTVSGCFLLNHLWGMEKAEKPLVEINHGILIRLLLSKSVFIQLIDYWLHFKDPARARKRALWRYQGKCVIMSLISAQHKSASQEYLWKKRSSSWPFRNCHFLTIIDTLGQIMRNTFQNRLEGNESACNMRTNLLLFGLNRRRRHIRCKFIHVFSPTNPITPLRWERRQLVLGKMIISDKSSVVASGRR